MQLKPPVNPAAAAAPFLAINPQPGSAPEGSAPGGNSAFARLMESQARGTTAPLPVPPPPALSSPAKEPLHQHHAPQGGGSNEARSPAPQSNEASSSRGKAEARPTQDNVSKAAAQQQTERNRLNAQREARGTAARAEARPAAPQSGQQPAKAANAKAADSQAASPDDEEGPQQPAGDDKLLSPLALLNLIGASAQALPSGSPGCGSLSDETEQALAAQDAATGLPGDGASALAAAGATVGTALPAAAGSGTDAAGDPLAGTAAASLLATSAHSPTSAKGLHPGLSPSQGGSAAASAGHGATSAADPAAGIALDSGLASKTAAQQAEWTAMAASGGLSGSQNAGRSGASGGAADALNPGNFAAALNGQMGLAAKDAASPVSVNLPTPVQSPEFREMLGAQVSLLAQDGVQSAELHLNPADMGPISVQITLDGTQARVDFGADSASTRQLIESGLPELASALRDAGLTLSGGGVSQHAPQQQQGRGDASSSGQGGDGRRAGADIGSSDNPATPVRSAATARRVALGGVDVYA